jgi:YVTN family beta-propeller protein
MRLLIVLLVCAVALAADWRPPAGVRAAARRPGAESVLPGGRVLSPLGRQFQTGPGPFGLALSLDGKFAVTANGGPNRYSLTLLDQSAKDWQVRQIVAPQKDEQRPPDDDGWQSVFLGLAFDKDRKLYASEGNSGRVRRVIMPSGKPDRFFELNQGTWRDSYSGDLALDEARGVLYVLDQAHFRVAVFDTRSGKLLANAPTGRLPFKMALSPDRRRIYVTNVGMLAYQVLPGADAKQARETGIDFPAFGFPSKEASEGVRRETARGAITVPGVGDPNAPESNSLCVIDVADPASPKVLRFVRTGEPFGPRSHGGSSPSGVVVDAQSIYVSNANQDSVTIIDAAKLEVTASVPIRIPGLESLRGVLPIGLALEPATGWLLVAEAGINAIGVIDTRRREVIGHFPAGWFPTALAVRKGTLFVSSAKGLGTGPNAGRTGPFPKSFQGEFRQGSLSVLTLPTADELKEHTRRVMTNNGFLPQKTPDGELPKEIQHVVIIVKENRTYDEVLGDMDTAANGPLSGAPELARFGQRGWVSQDRDSLQGRLGRRWINVTPNHHSIARRFALSDNFYVDSEVSVDGHHWIVGAYPNAWTESTMMASYGGQKDFRLTADAPGRLSFPQSNSSVHPEEQLEAGALWHHLERHNIRFRNFGEGFELAGMDEGPGEKPTGGRFLTNVPMPDPLYRNTSRDYPGFNMNIPDQFRAQAFIDEIETLYGSTGRPLPQLLFVHLPNDHMAKPRPADGFPFSASYVADNDYALGRILEYLSHKPWWKNMAVFITEDDAQGGVDHVDSHRTVFMLASPYARKNHSSKVNASFPAMLKAAFRLLNLPPLNLFDATAADLSECFTREPDFEPYEVVAADAEIFIPSEARDPLDPKPSPKMDDPRFLREQHRERGGQ